MKIIIEDDQKVCIYQDGYWQEEKMTNNQFTLLSVIKDLINAGASRDIVAISDNRKDKLIDLTTDNRNEV